MPLFIDPFLLFTSQKAEYQELHQEIIKYLVFLRDQSVNKRISEGLLKSWYCFHEVKQNWLGFSSVGNDGRGLGLDFARALDNSLNAIFSDFGNEKIAKGSHIEKLCLIKNGVGRDNISDFTTNLIKNHLLKYTEAFAIANIDAKYLKRVNVPKVVFNYPTKCWVNKIFTLPVTKSDFVILTPKDMLTRDDTWISRPDMINEFQEVCESMPDDALRAQLNDYLISVMPDNPAKKEKQEAIAKVIISYPEFIEHYIKHKEDTGDQAVSVSEEKVKTTEYVFIEKVMQFIHCINQTTDFYQKPRNTYQESILRIQFLKQVIENNDGYRVFYIGNEPVRSEKDLQLIFRLTWFETAYDINSEVNNGRGSVDYKVSHGNSDSTLIEFKLASNSQLKRNLENQVEIYEKANATKQTIKVIMYFTDSEYDKVNKILNELKLHDKEYVILIDARADNKPSASKAKSI